MEVLGEDGQPIMREWYQDVPDPGVPDLSWPEVLAHWDVLETDMHHFYGADMYDPEVKARPWRWFVVRVARLLVDPSAGLSSAVRPQPPEVETTPHGNA